MASASVFKLSSKHCSACNVDFASDEIRRVHAKSQWHVENLRRRVAGLAPIDASAIRPMDTETKPHETSDPDTDEVSTSDESDDHDSSLPANPPAFAPGQCLFCPEVSATFDDNLAHMEKSHGLHAKDLLHLAVDTETLIRYLHLVIFGYRECLLCHTQRRTVQAAQQHMIGKGHCRFDLDDPTSEYRDFFDLPSGGAEKSSGADALVHNPGEAARLPSGRIVSSRAASQPRRTTDHSEPEAKSSPLGGTSQAVLRKERREGTLSTQLASLSVGDRASLGHLSSPQQRAVLAAGKKQLDRARRAEQRYVRRVEMLGNKTLMKHFVNDVPGRTLG